MKSRRKKNLPAYVIIRQIKERKNLSTDILFKIWRFFSLVFIINIIFSTCCKEFRVFSQKAVCGKTENTLMLK